MSSNRYVGLSAQDTEAIFPNTVSKIHANIDGEDVDDFRQMNTGELRFALINAIKELNTRLLALEE